MAEAEIDLEALEQNIQESLGAANESDTETIEEVAEETVQGDGEAQEAEEAFDLDEAINSFEPVNLTGKITEEQAIEKAKERGWNEDGVDKYGHRVSAIEFLERSPFFHKFDLMRGDIDAQSEQIRELREQNKQIAQKSIEDKKKLNAELQAAKDELLSAEYLDSDDVAKLKKIDSQIESNVIDETQDETQDGTQQQEHVVTDYEEAQSKFAKNNDWYKKDYEMTMRAEEIGVTYAQEYKAQYGHIPPAEETFNQIANGIKKEFPEQAKPKRQARVASTQTRTVVSKVKKGKTFNDLPEDARAIAREVVESIPGMTEEDYMKKYEF